MPLTAVQRRELPDEAFAVPGKRALPIHDARHVSMAWARVGRDASLTDDEKAQARDRIRAKAGELAMDTSRWHAAEDKGLYVSRPLTPESAAEFRIWAKSQGFTHMTPSDELHVTVVYSAVAADLDAHTHEVRVEGGDRSVIRIGEKGAIALRFISEELRARWQEALDCGCVSDFEDYLPHVTIAWGNDPIEFDNVTPFLGDLVFGPEAHAAFDPEAADKAKARAMAQPEETGMKMEAAGGGIRFECERMEAMSLGLPSVPGHPNRMPFSGILTRLDKPSDRPPGGAKGKRVILTTAAAERALESLLGMAVNYTDDEDDHEVTRKIGVITAARIEGDAVKIGGILYARDFPKETSRIQTNKDRLGFSWELAEIFVQRLDADPLVITDAYFTGAAILNKDKAAYGSTSLAAAAAGDPEMTKEEIAAAVGESVGAAMSVAMKPLTDAMAGIAAQAEAATKAVATMQASAAEAEAAAKVAADKARDEEFEALKTQVKDLQAAAGKDGEQPARKTLPPAITALLAKADITMPDGDGKLNVGAVDAALSKAGLDPVKRIEIKSALQRAKAL